MNDHHNKYLPGIHIHRHFHRGVSLIELMVSIAIGLIIILGIIQVFSANRETYTAQESLGQLQENGQYAINFIARHLRKAGYYPNPYSLPGTKALHELRAFGAALPINGVEGGGAANDTVSVSYYTTGTDCVGNAPAGGARLGQNLTPTSLSATGAIVPRQASAIAVNVIAVATGASGRPSLFCNSVEITEGVENLQIRYGEDTNNDGFIDKYSTLDQVTNVANVMIAQVAILVATTGEPSRDLDTDTYDLLGTIVDPIDDGRYRRVYTATIRIRNRCAMLMVTSGSKPCA